LQRALAVLQTESNEETLFSIVVAIRRALANTNAIDAIVEVFNNQKEELGKIFVLINKEECSLKMMRELTWITINMFCLTDEITDYLESNFNAMKVLVNATQRCNKLEEQQLSGQPHLSN